MLSIKAVLLCVTLYFIVSVRAIDNLISEIIVAEGTEALLTFRYTSESPVPYKLCMGQREPFYMDGQLLWDNLTPSQQKRFRVQALHKRVHRETSVQIVIEKVQRTDGGSYTCSFYGDETTPSRSKEMTLTVNFPPGIANCESMPTETKGWDEIQCTAKGGSPPGIIVCQAFNNEEVPVRQTLRQNATHITNKFLINHKTSVNCCAKNDVNLNDPTCVDFVLKRDGPFDKSTVQSYKEATDSNTKVPTENSDSAGTTKSNTKILMHSRNLNIVAAIVIPIVSVIVVGVIMVILYISCSLNDRANPKGDYSEVRQDLPETKPNATKVDGRDNYSDDKNEQKSTTEKYDGTLEAKGKELETKFKEKLGTELTSTRKPPETQANAKR